MIGLDTNVLVRYAVQDDAEQSARATQLMESLDEDNQGYISVVALVELHWVLRRTYKVGRETAAGTVRKLLDARELALQEPDAVRRALARTGADVDFPDALISEFDNAAGCDHTVTFDRRAARLPGMQLID